MKLIVGLGNPGSEYKTTKHNIGCQVVEALAKENKIKINKIFHSSLIGKGRIEGEEVTLALPQTYMNLSGHAVSELIGRDLKTLEDMLVICDDIHLELGKIRMKKQGSSGGQKGLESVIHMLKTSDFPRLRVGIAADVPKGDISDYVLSPFKHKDARNAVHAVRLAGEAATSFIKDGMDKAMNSFNIRKVGTS